MYKQIFTISAFALISGIALGQTTGRVGINTTTPATTLDIKGKTTDGNAVEGVLTPQVTGDALKAMKDKMGAAQNGNLVFVTSAVTTPDDATDNVTFPGYYRFNYDAINTAKPKSFVRIEPSGLERIVSKTDPNDRMFDSWRLIGENSGRTNTSEFEGVNIDMAVGEASNFGNLGTDGVYNVAIGAGAYAKGTSNIAIGTAQSLSEEGGALPLASQEAQDFLPRRAIPPLPCSAALQKRVQITVSL